VLFEQEEKKGRQASLAWVSHVGTSWAWFRQQEDSDAELKAIQASLVGVLGSVLFDWQYYSAQERCLVWRTSAALPHYRVKISTVVPQA
jgi:hypothetical protein